MYMNVAKNLLREEFVDSVAVDLHPGNRDHPGDVPTYGGKFMTSFLSDLKFNDDSSAETFKTRFPSIEVIDAFGIFDPTEMPTTIPELNAYGNDKMEVLCEHYGELVGLYGETGVDKSAMMTQWTRFRRIMFDSYRNTEIFTFFHRGTNAFTTNGFRDASINMMLDFIEIITCLILGNAECERAFSHMNAIWTLERNALLIATTRNIMLCKLIGPHLADDTSDADSLAESDEEMADDADEEADE
ncbi:hypothetical protein CYMTET_15004 [Cymbomonas tetramitiformis]|uniref:Uncharacterized protein n=1 Tax=Cymbomonas tetramitiformis TaxID=36881 RepID=A0AAE0GFD3_9CHLO|nr:hypothetical protein CYMTET_15004 [Cymbomonas tetramitiformis]